MCTSCCHTLQPHCQSIRPLWYLNSSAEVSAPVWVYVCVCVCDVGVGGSMCPYFKLREWVSDSPHTHFSLSFSPTPLLCASPLFSHQWVDPVSKPKSYSSITKRPAFPLLCVCVCVCVCGVVDWARSLYVNVCCGCIALNTVCVIMSNVCVFL